MQDVDVTIQVHINFVVEMPDGGYRLVLVEGPWEGDDSQNLKRLSKRICDCVTAAVNGYVTERFPGLVAKPVTIQVDSYSTPKAQVDRLLAHLQATFDHSAEIQDALASGRFASSITLTHQWKDFDEEFERRMRSDLKPQPRWIQKLTHWLSRRI